MYVSAPYPQPLVSKRLEGYFSSYRADKLGHTDGRIGGRRQQQYPFVALILESGQTWK